MAQPANRRIVTEDKLTAGQVVYRAPGDVTAPSTRNLYGNGYATALGPRWTAGGDAAPVTDARPVVWVQKHSSADRGVNASEWDQGAVYGALVKESGSAYGAGVTGYARHLTPGTGQIIGVHGRGHGDHAGAQVWGAWSYAASASTTVANHTTIGHEVNVTNRAPDQGWMDVAGVGATRALVVAPVDGSNPITQGIYVGGGGSSAPNGKIHTGLLFRGGGIVPSGANTATGVNNNEAVRIEGAPTQADGYVGVRFRGGNLRVGISFAETAFANNAAILMGNGQRIVVGAGPAANRYVAFDETTALVNFGNLSLAINGTKVIGTRSTGWGTPAGITTKDSFDTATVTTLGVAQRLAALINTLRNHGLIGD